MKKSQKMAWSVVTVAPSRKPLCATYSVCAVCGMADCRESKGCSESKPEARTATSA